MRSWSTAASGSPAIQPVLPPEQNAVPAPVTTTTRNDRSAASSSTAATHDAVISSDIALRWSGLSSVSTAIPSAGGRDAGAGGSSVGSGMGRSLLASTPGTALGPRLCQAWLSVA